MTINRVNSTNVISIYNKSSKSAASKKTESVQTDSVEISSLGKKVSTYSLDNKFDNKSKIDEIKKQVENGTYDRNSKLIAQKLLDHIKGKGV